MAATDQQLSDAAREAQLDVLETAEFYTIEGVQIQRSLDNLRDFQDWVDSRKAKKRPMYTKLRVR